jgi:hypothetical protein
MPAGPNFYETFNPESIVPLAMKKFDIDLKKRQLDMMEQEHKLKIESTAMDLAAKKEWADFMKGQPETTYSGLEPLEAGGGGLKEGAQGTETKLVPPSSQEIYRKVMSMAKPGELLKALTDKPEKFASSPLGIFSTSNGNIITPAPPKPVTPAVKSQSEVAKKIIDIHGEEAYNAMTAEQRINAHRNIEAKDVREPLLTADQRLIEKDLTDKLGRSPTAGEIRKEEEASKSRVAAAGVKAREDAKSEGGFKDWTPEAKSQAFKYHNISGKPPVSAQGFAGTNRKDYDREYQQWKVDSGLTANDIALMQADYKAGDSSLRNMTKQEYPMKAFVDNINTQVDYAKELFSGLKRFDTRLINLPLRELKTRVVGSGLERKYELFLQEISMEANKLAQGSSASIAQIPEGNRKEWLRIHDINLPLSEILPVLEGTKTMANMRLSTWQESKQVNRNEIMKIGGGDQGGKDKDPLGIR